MKYILTPLIILSVIGFSYTASAEERNRSGSYQTERGSGSWQNKVNRDGKGNLSGETNWQNQRGEGSSVRNRNFDSETSTGTSSRVTTNAQGNTATTEKSFTGNQDGTGGTLSGSRTGYSGATQDINKTYTKNEDGSVTVDNSISGEKSSYSNSRTFNNNE